jgi:hypothetical protein
LDERQLHWHAFAKGALGGRVEDAAGAPVLAIGGRRYATDWAHAASSEVELIRVDQSPFVEALQRWREHSAAPVRLKLVCNQLQHKFVDLDALKGLAGVLQCRRLNASTFDAGEYLLVAACTSNGDPINEETARRMLLVPAEAAPTSGLDTTAAEALGEQLLAAPVGAT